jgi:AcrR family transcriptional regulator
LTLSAAIPTIVNHTVDKVRDVADRSRRKAILDSAEREFGALGYAGARIERIAATAGVNKQLVFHYFGSKDGLYVAAVNALFDGISATLPTAATAGEALRRTASDLAALLRENPGAARAIADCAMGAVVPAGASSVVAGWLANTKAKIAGVVADGQRRGFFRDDVDPQDVANIAIGALVGDSILDGVGAHGSAESRGLVSDSYTDIGKVMADYCAWR